MSGVRAPRLGIDFGRVITGGEGPGDTPFIQRTVETVSTAPAIEGAIPALGKLVEAFDKRVWIVSKAGAGMQRKTLTWLDHNYIWSRTGLPLYSICFVLNRSDKAPVAMRQKLTHFIDDKIDCLEPMVGRVDNLFLFGAENAPEGMIPVKDWSELDKILNTL